MLSACLFCLWHHLWLDGQVLPTRHRLKNFGGDHWWHGSALAKGGKHGQERQEGWGKGRSGPKECHQSIRGNRQSAERGQMSQMAEIKTVQRVGVAGGWGAQKSRNTIGGKDAWSPGQPLPQTGLSRQPLGLTQEPITVASRKSLRADPGNTGNSTDMQCSTVHQKSCPRIFIETIYNSSTLETTQMLINIRIYK